MRFANHDLIYIVFCCNISRTFVPVCDIVFLEVIPTNSYPLPVEIKRALTTRIRENSRIVETTSQRYYV